MRISIGRFSSAEMMFPARSFSALEGDNCTNYTLRLLTDPMWRKVSPDSEEGKHAIKGKLFEVCTYRALISIIQLRSFWTDRSRRMTLS